MARPGDEGYEELSRCPFDQSHEIRKGRMQFHIEKCRRNFPNVNLVECPFNKMHTVREELLQYHLEEECESRTQWERYSHVNESQVCPVKDLVPVNDTTVPDGGENWDDFEAPSVLQHIQETLNNKPVVRHFQVHSKAKKKAFRKAERDRHRSLNSNIPSGNVEEDCASDEKSEITSEFEFPSLRYRQEPLPRPTMVAPRKMDRNEAMAIINKNMKKLGVEDKPPVADIAPFVGEQFDNSYLEAASTSRGPEAFRTEEIPSTSQQRPFSYAQVSSARGKARSILASRDVSRPSSALSHSSFATSSRPGSAMSNCSSVRGPPPGFTSRPDTGMSTASFHTANQMSSAMSTSSFASYQQTNDGFCSLPIPGLQDPRPVPFARGRKPVQ